MIHRRSLSSLEIKVKLSKVDWLSQCSRQKKNAKLRLTTIKEDSTINIKSHENESNKNLLQHKTRPSMIFCLFSLTSTISLTIQNNFEFSNIISLQRVERELFSEWVEVQASTNVKFYSVVHFIDFHFSFKLAITTFLLDRTLFEGQWHYKAVKRCIFSWNCWSSFFLDRNYSPFYIKHKSNVLVSGYDELALRGSRSCRNPAWLWCPFLNCWPRKFISFSGNDNLNNE